MKILIKKDIPGYKAGEIAEINSVNLNTHEKKLRIYYSYNYYDLIEEGFAEEVKEVDIEAIRKQFDYYSMDSQVWAYKVRGSELRVFTAYRIVKTLIDKLNETEESNGKFVFAKVNDINDIQFAVREVTHKMFHYSVLPICHTQKIALKVIELCQPELEVLFNIE